MPVNQSNKHYMGGKLEVDPAKIHKNFSIDSPLVAGKIIDTTEKNRRFAGLTIGFCETILR